MKCLSLNVLSAIQQKKELPHTWPQVILLHRECSSKSPNIAKMFVLFCSIYFQFCYFLEHSYLYLFTAITVPQPQLHHEVIFGLKLRCAMDYIF